MHKQLFEVQGLCADVEYLVMGQLQNNVYLISDGEGTLVVDPSCDADAILEALGERRLDAIVLTHNHNDHTGAAAALRAATGAEVVASAADAEGVAHPEPARWGAPTSRAARWSRWPPPSRSSRSCPMTRRCCPATTT